MDIIVACTALQQLHQGPFLALPFMTAGFFALVGAAGGWQRYGHFRLGIFYTRDKFWTLDLTHLVFGIEHSLCTVLSCASVSFTLRCLPIQALSTGAAMLSCIV